MVLIKKPSYDPEQPFIAPSPSVGQYEIPSQFPDPSTPLPPHKIALSPTFKGKHQPPLEEKVMQKFPSPMDYDVLNVDNEQNWIREKQRSTKGSFPREHRKPTFLRTGISGGTVAYSPPKSWNTTSGASKWFREKNKSPHRERSTSPGPNVYFEEGIPSTNEKRSSKFGSSTRFKKNSEWIGQDPVGPGLYSPERYSPTKQIGVEMRGRTYTDMDFSSKEKRNIPGPNHYSPEKSRRTPPSNQKRGYTMGRRLTTTFGTSSIGGSASMGSSLFSTMTSGSFNNQVGPGSYNHHSTIGISPSASMKGSYKEPKRDVSPGPGDYFSSSSHWSNKNGSPAYSFGGRNLPKLKGKHAHGRFNVSRSTSPRKEPLVTPGPSSYNIPSEFDNNVRTKRGYSMK